MNEVVTQLIMLFGYIAVGFVCNKVHILDEVSDKYFSKLLLEITLPASIIASSIGQDDTDKMQAFIILGLAVAIFLFLPLLGAGFQKLTKCEDTYKLMLTYSNLGFMGIPIMNAMYGDTGTFYASLFMMIFNVSVFSYGVSVLDESGKGMDFKQLISPGMLSAVIALMIFSIGISVPALITKFLTSVGSVTSPLAMITLGSTIAAVNFKEAAKNKMLYIFSACKIIVWPAIVYGILQFFITDSVILGVCTILISLPVAGNVNMLCISYDGNKKLAAEGTCISTVLSLVSIPVYMMLFL